MWNWNLPANRVKACDFLPHFLGERNRTSTKGRSRWKSSSENYLVIAEVRFRVRFRFRVMVRVGDLKTIFHENYFWWMSNCVFPLFASQLSIVPVIHIEFNAQDWLQNSQYSSFTNVYGMNSLNGFCHYWFLDSGRCLCQSYMVWWLS